MNTVPLSPLDEPVGEARGVGGVDGVGAAGEDDDAGVVGGDLSEGGGAAEDEGEDVEGADAAGDEVGVLGAEVEDEDCVGLHRGSLHE